MANKLYKDEKEAILILFEQHKTMIRENLLKITNDRKKKWLEKSTKSLLKKAQMLEKRNASCAIKIKISYYHRIGNMERTATVPISGEFAEEMIKKYFSKLPDLRKTSQLREIEYEISQLQWRFSNEVEENSELVDEVISEAKKFLLNADDLRQVNTTRLAIVSAAAYWACRKKNTCLDIKETLKVFARKVSKQDLVDELYLANEHCIFSSNNTGL